LKGEATGTIDPRLREPLKLEWEEGEEFKQAAYYVTTTPVFSAKLKIDNPRKEILNLQIECSFKDSQGRRNFSGTIFPSDQVGIEERSKEIEAERKTNFPSINAWRTKKVSRH